jgi:multidrug efflux pump subunit AcrB
MLFSLAIAFIVTPWAAIRMLKRMKDEGGRMKGDTRAASPNVAGAGPEGAKSTSPGQASAPPWVPEKETSCPAGAASPATPHSHFEHEEDFFTRLYRRIMGPLLSHARWRWTFLAAIVGLLLASMALVGIGFVKVKMLPFDNKSEFQIILNMPEGSALERTTQAALEMAAAVRDEPEVKDYQVYAGVSSPFNFNGLVRHYYLRRGPNVADIQVNLVEKGQRSDQSHAIAKRIRPLVAAIAKKHGAAVAVAEVPPGPPVLQSIVAEIYGPDESQRIALAREVRRIMEKTEGVVDIDWYVEAPQPKVRFVIDKAKAALHGISEATVTQALHLAAQGAQVDLLHLPAEREDVPIIFELPPSARSQPEALLALSVRSDHNPAAPLVPLSELVRIERVTAGPNLYRKNLKPVTYVTADVAGKVESPAYAMFAIDAELRRLDARKFGATTASLPIYHLNVPADDHSPALKWDGEWHITLEVFRDLGLAFAAVLVLIAMLMVGWFRSYVTPLVVMAAIPFSLIGILPAHWAFGAFFTATSMIGFMAGAGIVVRNSIILVDFIELRRAHGLPLRDAVVEAGAVRFRPMLLTALAVVVGASVILADPIFQGLALSLMFGEIASLLISRMAVPVLYYMANQRAAAAGATTSA